MTLDISLSQPQAEHHAVREARRKYPGQYVALYQGRILAHATDAATLLERVRRDFGLTSTDVLLIKAETSTELRGRHPRLAI